jgi:HSP20 family molecular chaperone IbpA
MFNNNIKKKVNTMKKNYIFLKLILICLTANDINCSDILESLKEILKAEQQFLESITEELAQVNSTSNEKIAHIKSVDISEDENNLNIVIAIPQELNNEEALNNLSIEAGKKNLEGKLENKDNSLYFSIYNNLLFSISKTITKKSSEEKSNKSSVSSSSNTITLSSKVETNDAKAELVDGKLIITLVKIKPAANPNGLKKINIKR